MPVLDTQIRVGVAQKEWNNPGGYIPGELPFHQGNAKKIVLYQFYRKPISNVTPLNARTAAPTKQLMQTCVDEYRRLRNRSRLLPVDTINSVIREYTTDLLRGGFTKDWVNEAISSAMRWYGKQCRKELDGGPPLNCPEHVGKNARRVKHLLAKSNWFQKDPVNDDQEDDQIQTSSK